MKKLMFLSALYLFSTAVHAQTVNDIPLKDIDVEYVEIVGTPTLFSNKVNVQLDFGQENKVFSFKDTQIKDENGRIMKMNSMIDALNFMSANGYEFVQAYIVDLYGGSSNSATGNVYHYLMRRKKS